MGHKPEATSIPPDTGKIDSDWSDMSSVVDTTGPTAGATAVPPKPYEEYARRASQGRMTDEEARRALSAPSMPVIDVSDVDDLLGIVTRDSGELDASMPLIGQQRSGPYEIPLELGDDGEELRPSEAPATTRQAQPQFALTPRIEAPESGHWGDEAPTPAATSPEALLALRHATTPGRPTIRTGVRADDPEISIGAEMVDLDLDEPEGISMEDSLELSLDNIPPAPFEMSPGFPPETARPSKGSLDLSLDVEGDALGLVAARATPVVRDPDDPLVDLRDRYAVGDFTGAHEIAESILIEDPTNSEALRFRESCRDVLIQMYTARLGSTSRIPKLAIATAELQWLSLDHRAGFLLSCVDGRSSIEEILDVSGMPALDAMRILYTLLQQRIIDVVGE